MGAGASSLLVNKGTVTQAGAASTIGVRASNIRTIAVASGMLDLTGSVSGSGTMTIGAGTLEIGGTIARTQAIDFAAGSTGTLQIDAGHGFAGTVAGFARATQSTSPALPPLTLG